MLGGVSYRLIRFLCVLRRYTTCARTPVVVAKGTLFRLIPSTHRACATHSRKPDFFPSPRLMTQDTKLTTFLEDPENRIRNLRLAHLDRVLKKLAEAERPESFQIFIRDLLNIVPIEPNLGTDIFQAWKPTEGTMAQLLEDVGRDGVPVVLAMADEDPESRRILDRLFKLSDELGGVPYVTPTDPWERISRIPMIALLAEQQLDQLVEAVKEERQWKNPAEILDPDGNDDLDLESIITLAQARMNKPNGSIDALNIVTIRLLNWVDKMQAN